MRYFAYRPAPGRLNWPCNYWTLDEHNTLQGYHDSYFQRPDLKQRFFNFKDGTESYVRLGCLVAIEYPPELNVGEGL